MRVTGWQQRNELARKKAAHLSGFLHSESSVNFQRRQFAIVQS